MRNRVDRSWSWIPVGWMVLACGGAGAPAAPPPAAASAERAPSVAESKASAAPASSTSAEPAAPASAAPPPAEESPFTSKPHDILCGENTSYAFNFRTSDAGKQAEEKCRSSAGDTPQALSQCMDKARDKAGATVLRCVKKDRVWWWLTYERRGQNLVVLHKIPIEFAEETKDRVTLRPTGKDMGLAPLAGIPPKVVVRMATEYSIEIEDPKLGKMVYDAKIGMIQ